MSPGARPAPVAHRFERVLGRFRGRPRRPWRGPPVIAPYIGYATPEHLILRGRVLTALRRATPRDGQGWLGNLVQMLSLFFTGEVAGVAVTAGEYSALSDEEGYFVLPVPRAGRTGWIEIEARTGEGASCVLPAVAPDSGARLGVISDIDDTVMETGAWSLLRNLRTSLTGNVSTRRIFPDAIRLMSALSEAGRNPVFYVSSSPWNLHGFLEAVFARNGLVLGPIFLRDLGISRDNFVTEPHGTHKGGAIDRILAANPGLPFLLVGDTGQHDAEVYAAAARRHPGRIARVILRAPGPGADIRDMAQVAALRAMGVPVHVEADFTAALAQVGAAA